MAGPLHRHAGSRDARRDLSAKCTFVIDDYRAKQSLRPGKSAVAGVYVSQAQNIVAPPNAVAVVEAQLRAMGVAYHLVDNRPVRPVIDWQDKEQLRQVLPAELKANVPALGHPLDYLLDWQREVIAFSAHREGTFIRVDAGGGKTFVYIIWGLLYTGLVVAIMKAGARVQFYEEVRRITNVKPRILEGEKPSAIEPDTRMVILGWEILHAWLPAILAAKPASFIADEIHRVKQHRRAKATIDVHQMDADGNVGMKFERLGNISDCASQLARASFRRMGGTATPISDRTHDLWSQFDIVEPGMWGDSLTFDQRYCQAHKNNYGRWERKGTATGDRLTELRARMATFLYDIPRSKSHIGLIGMKRRQVSMISGKSQGRAASGFLDALRKAVKGRERDKAFELSLQEAATRKRPYVLDRVDEAVRNGQKVFVFTGRTKDCEELADAVRDRVAKIGAVKFKGPDDVEHVRECDVFMYHGGLQGAEKQLNALRWSWMGFDGDEEAGQASVARHPGPAVVVCTAQSLGESYSFHDTDLAIHAVLPINPKEVEQREGRFSRHGQVRSVLNDYPVAEGTVDERLVEILLDKLPAVEAITSAEGVRGFAHELSGDGRREEILDELFDTLTQRFEKPKASKSGNASYDTGDVATSTAREDP